MFCIYIFLLCITCVSNEHLQLQKDAECFNEGVKGQCVEVHRCLTSVRDIAQGHPPPICSYQNNTQIICCTDCELVNDTRLIIIDAALGMLNKTGTSKAKDKCLDYIHSAPYKCKEYKGYLQLKNFDSEKNCSFTKDLFYAYVIDGGVDAERDEFPHMALLGYGDSIENADWLCGGSVISERYILTAGHCTSTPALGSVKYIGLGILKRTDPFSMWQTYNVKRIVLHPEYKPPSKYNDIALLETDREITFSPQVLPACLHVDGDLDEIADATGWGTLGHGKELADVLQTVPLHKFNDEECSKTYPKHRLLKKGYNNTTQMCYGDRNISKDTCQGDSGGPLQSRNHERCVYTILGVTSYGRQCGNINSAGMYTRVFHYVPWIESIVWP